MAARASGFAGSRVRSSVRASAARVQTGVVARSAPWAPGNDAPAHLDGTLPGDFGFDPLGLGKNPEKLSWYVQAELQNARWAMLGAAGIIVPDLLTKIGFPWPGQGVSWVEANTFKYYADPGTLAVVMVFAFGWAESKRFNDIKNPGSQNEDPIFKGNKISGKGVGYPGLDPLSLGNGSDFKERQLKEIKNGRLAMLAMLGFFVQAATTGATPLDNLFTHLANPWSTTVLTNLDDLFVWKWTDPTFLGTLAPIRGLPLI